ncbi:MAG: WbqC family protein [Proteobacteria bacterium]|nr:WbqC family protein [Pseudomonadota bacterium]
MILAVHQPQFLPWQGYMMKMDAAHVFCFLDSVQFKKNEWQNRNRIRTAEGWQWLTVPVLHRFGQRIGEVRINPAEPWQKKHLRALEIHCGRTPYFRWVMDILEPVYGRSWESLAHLNRTLAEALARALGMECRFFASSETDLPGEPTGRLVELCRQTGADTYLAGAGGAGYMDLAQFEAAGIRVVFQDFRQPGYPQAYPGFVPGLSMVDLLFSQGENSLKLLRETNPE